MLRTKKRSTKKRSTKKRSTKKNSDRTRKLKHHNKPEKKSILTQIGNDISTYSSHKMSRSMVACGGFWNTLLSGSLMCKKAPVTGRNWHSYSQHLFGDISKRKLVSYLSTKLYLDIGSGLNHIYPNSLLYKVARKSNKKAVGMDIHPFPNSRHFINGSIFKTGFPDKSFEMITSQYLVYYWIDDVKRLKKVFRELHRILKKSGQFRVYPVFHGDYHYNDSGLMRLIHKLFRVETYQPRFVKERVRYIDISDIDSKNIKNNDKIAIKNMKIAPAEVSQKESEDHKSLNAHTLVFTKL